MSSVMVVWWRVRQVVVEVTYPRMMLTAEKVRVRMRK
jgi:hypothetical protein